MVPDTIAVNLWNFVYLAAFLIHFHFSPFAIS